MRSEVMPVVLVGAGILLAAVWGWRHSTRGPQLATATTAGVMADLIVGEPVQFENLTIFPVTSRVPRNEDRFITLAEGLESGLVSITEVGVRAPLLEANPFAEPAEEATPDESSAAEPIAAEEDPFVADNPFDDRSAASMAGPMANPDEGYDNPLGGGANVNRLLVTNLSDRPLYLMPGEIVVGGQQDRTIGQELVVAPHTKRMPIEVFCVEHGRWSARTHAESAQLAVDLSGDAANAAEAVERLGGSSFGLAGGYVSKSVRQTVHSGQGQGAVWDQVDAMNTLSGVMTDSSAFTANYADAGVSQQLKRYAQALREPVAQAPQVVGVIVAVNGQVEAIDTFESTPLFRKLWPKLLESYALDAVMQRAGTANAPPCDATAANSMLLDIMQTEEVATTRRDGLVTTRGDSPALTSFSLHEPQPAESAAAEGTDEAGGGGTLGGGMMGGFGNGVHSSAFAK